MKIPLLDLKAQYAIIRDEIRACIDGVCDEQYFILGPKVEQFERHIADYCGTAHAVGISSGTDAILVALMALDVGPGDAVITSPYTFFATAGCIARLGATPVFVDIDPVTFNIDPDKLIYLLKKKSGCIRGAKPKVLMPVHLFGQCANMESLSSIASEHGLDVIEDAAQAIGSEYPAANGVRKAGSMGKAGCFSFFPSKNLGGFGDGGMVTTNDPAFAEKLKVLRNHGAEKRYYHKHIGGNFRLDAIQAAVLDVKLKYLEDWHESRRRNAEFYYNAFKGTCVKAPEPIYSRKGPKNYHIYNQYVIRVPDRDAVLGRLRDAGIGCEVYYPVPLHLQECFRYLGCREGDFPESEKAAKETLALPVYPELTEEMMEYVVKNVLAAVEQ